MTDRSWVILTEYVELEGGGRLNQLDGHLECRLSLDVICHLAHEAGFSVRTISLSDFLDLCITAPVLTRRFGLFLKRILGYEISVTLPAGSARLARLLGQTVNGHGGLLSRAELQRFVSAFHVFILTKRPTRTAAQLQANSVISREPDVLKIHSSTRQPFLLKPHPLAFHHLTDTGEYLWDRLDGRRTIRDLAALLARRYDVSQRRATQDALAFLRTAHRHRYVS